MKYTVDEKNKTVTFHTSVKFEDISKIRNMLAHRFSEVGKWDILFMDRKQKIDNILEE